MTVCDQCGDTGAIGFAPCPCWELQIGLADLAETWTLCKREEFCRYPLNTYARYGWCDDHAALWEHQTGTILEP